MAAMFQAQSANWEETQEKMSQLVSRPCAFLVYSSRLDSNELRFFSSVVLRWPSLTVLLESIQTREGAHQVVVAVNRSTHTTSLSARYLPAMSVTAADRKVRTPYIMRLVCLSL